jgi:hypothetical protein
MFVCVYVCVYASVRVRACVLELDACACCGVHVAFI